MLKIISPPLSTKGTSPQSSKSGSSLVRLGPSSKSGSLLVCFGPFFKIRVLLGPSWAFIKIRVLLGPSWSFLFLLLRKLKSSKAVGTFESSNGILFFFHLSQSTPSNRELPIFHGVDFHLFFCTPFKLPPLVSHLQLPQNLKDLK